MPHEHRHILGWYRLIQELREHGIRAICVFDGEERTVAKSNEVCVYPPVASTFVDRTQQNRRRQIRRTDVLRGEMESDRLRRLLDLTKGLDALHLLGNHERLLTMAWLHSQASIFEDRLVPKSSDLTDPTDHSPRGHLPDAEFQLTHGEFPCPDEAVLDELYHKNGLLVDTNTIEPQESDMVYVASLVASGGNEDFSILDSRASPVLVPRTWT
jgi:hypothetical protein